MSHFLTGVSVNLVEECHSGMLYDNMNISLISWFMLNMWKRVSQGEKVWRTRWQSHMKVVSQMVGLTFKTSIDLKRGFLINILPNFQRMMMIGCLAICLKSEEVLAHQARSQHVESLARSIMVIALLGHTITLGVEREDTRLGIALN